MAELDYGSLLNHLGLHPDASLDFVARRYTKLVLETVTICAANARFRQWFGIVEPPHPDAPLPLTQVLNAATIATSLAITQQLVRILRGETVRGDGLTLAGFGQPSRQVRVTLSAPEHMRCILTLEDVTAEVNAELARAEGELLVRALLHGLDEPLAVVDVERHSLALVSPSFALLLGYEPEELAEVSWRQILSTQSIGDEYPRVAAETGSLKGELTLLTRQGDSLPAVVQFDRVLLPMPRDMVRVRVMDAATTAEQSASPEATRQQLTRANRLMMLHQRRARMLRDLAVLADESSHVLNLLESCLPVLAAVGGWPLARVVANNGSSLVGLDVWHGSPDEATREAFEAQPLSLESRLGRSLVHDRSARWSRTVGIDNHLSEPARQLLENGRGWVPIAVDEKVDYVIELLGAPRHFISVHTLQALREAAEQVAMTIGRLRAEASLRAHEAQTRAVFEYSPIASLHLDSRGRILSCNQAATQMLAEDGNRAILQDKTLYDFVAPQDVVQAAMLLEKAVEDVKGSNAELRIVSPLGHHLIANTSVSVVASDGVVHQLVLTLDDITDLKRVEHELRLSEQRFRTVFEHAMHGIAMFGSDGSIHQLNARFAQLLGVDLGRVQHVDDLVTGKGTSEWTSGWARAREGYPARFELPLPDSEGRFRILDVTLKPVTDEQGEVSVLVGSATDITAVRRALTERDRLLRAMSERMHELQCLYAVAVSAQEGGSTAQMLQRASTVMGRKWPADNSARLRITYRELQLDVGTDGVESNLPLQVGGTNENLVVDLIEDGRSQSHSDFQAAIYRILHLAAQRQRTEEELRSAREQAEVASKAKSAFLAHVSHEIRTPMNAILGFAQLLHRDSELTSDQRTRVERILRAGDHLTSLINSVLEISKIESGHVRMEMEVFELRTLLEDVEAMFAARAAEKGLSFQFSSTALPTTVRSDPGKLRQILINLVGNAVKFTDSGFVSVEVDHVIARRNIQLRCSVADSGPGIAAEDVNRIFERFESGNHWSHVGTGLGLSISREYAELLGGSLTVRSVQGEGSVFKLDVPVEVVRDAPKARAVKPATPRNVERLNALVVDDNPDNREVLTEMLGDVGLRSSEAIDGRQAVEMCREEPYDLVFMDLSMPEMDGIEATKRLRRMQHMRRAKVIVVSARAFDQDRRRALEAGADAFLGKPFTAEQLAAVLTSITGKANSGSFRRATPPKLAANKHSKMTGEPLELSNELLAQCVTAAREANVAELERLISAVGEQHSVAAAQLRALSDGFDYEGVVKLVGQWQEWAQAANSDERANAS